MRYGSIWAENIILNNIAHTRGPMMDGVKEILFITGNDDKFKEFQATLKTIKFKRKKLDLPELQGSSEHIAKEKARLACRITGKDCIVEDTSLCFDAWNGLPGPYIKDFLRLNGEDKVADILMKSSKNHSAKAVTVIGFARKGEEPVCIVGVTKGRITTPRGDKNFAKGWDKIFMPEGSGKTHAQMSPKEKMKISQRTKAIRAFERFLEGSDRKVE